ncbi:MAG: exonuclease domain-containing protein [Chloroflexi bacterium]|nr:exonuclease domain-containing protein [Chloroflexota bacterium]
MPRTFVALDLETTGLNPDRDAIIEVGAIKFRDDEPVDRLTTLVNPGRPIPYEIQQLTGISNEDVLGQPRFDQVAGPLMRFVGSLPVVGHSVSFDLGFVRARGLLNDNVGLDTWELATILLPNLPGYSLRALAGRFALSIPGQHRAADDATTTGHLFLRLCEQAARLPRPVLMEIVRLAHGSDWPAAQLFDEALTAAGVIRGATEEIPLDQLAPGSPLFQPVRLAEPLAAVENPTPVDVAGLAAMLKPDGAVGRAFPGYEFRLPQVAMLEAVAGAFNHSHHLLAEAGTGTGKSLAYLLPAIAYATQNGTRVVVSTNTINLQDQLYKKDLPDLQRILAGAWGKETPFRAALLKGRSNYLCPRRFASLKGRTHLSHDELRGIARILAWLPTTQTGDQGELSLPLPSDRFVWSQVAADNEGCTLDRCQRDVGGRCFFFRARKQADAAHVVVVNHALLMADAATDYRVLPEYHHLIIDEAHHLEDAVTDQLSFRADSGLLAQLFTALYPRGGGRQGQEGGAGRGGRGGPRASARPAQPAGLLAEIQSSLRAHLSDKLFGVVRDPIIRLQGDVEAVHGRLENFWEVLNDALATLQPQADNSEYDARIRITAATRAQPVWVEIEVSWENLALTWQQALGRLGTLAAGLKDLQDAGHELPGLDGMMEDLATAERRLTELYEQMEAWVARPAANGVYWVEIAKENGPSRRVTLRSAPLHVGPLVQEHILFHNDTVILTSATLRTAGSFEYLRDRLYAQEADTVAVGSPFDYKESTLLYLPSDLPEPNAPTYQTAVEQTLIGLTKALGGRTLALFTSYAQLRRTRDAILPALRQAGIEVLSQGGGASRHQLLESFKAGARTILLGTRSFWEGVDVVGPALSALVLVRLPFAVPSDPIVAARRETFDDAFYNYSVPDAILRFRQGFGRLIRSKTDRGVVVVLDKRVQSKGYGQLFLDSLPECTVHKGPLMNLPAAAQRWVDGA